MAAAVGGDGGGHKKSKKKKKGKKHSTTIDMTPMVDLGFLLLTFFVLTTTMSTPKSMPIALPEKLDKDKPEEKVDQLPESQVLHILLGPEDKIYLYQGVAKDTDEPIDLKTTNYGKDGIRKRLLEYRGTIEAQHGKGNSVFLIKAMEASRYKNLVDMLDEMNIIQQKKYALVDISPEEVELLAGGSDAGSATASK